MNNLFFFSVAAMASLLLSASNAQAQMFPQGFQFGAGLQAGGLGNCGGFFRAIPPREQPPYFAQFPPVYYSHIVPRPYGISPYAVPAGILPAEMMAPTYLPTPTVIKNPHFNGPAHSEDNLPVVEPTDIESTDIESTDVESTEGKSTATAPQSPRQRAWVSNPHFHSDAKLVTY